jgi:DNA-binding MarR family transcriptional regulator
MVPTREQFAYHLATLLKKARRQMTLAIKAQLEPTGACLAAIHLLKRATAGDSLSQLELSQEIELEPAALSRLLAELEEDALVVRRRDPHDKRRVLMEATPAGLALLDRTRPLVLAGVKTLTSRLDQDEQRQLCRLLEKLSGTEPSEDESSATASRPGKKSADRAMETSEGRTRPTRASRERPTRRTS